MGLQICTAVPQFYVSSRDLNACSHTCTSSSICKSHPASPSFTFLNPGLYQNHVPIISDPLKKKKKAQKRDGCKRQPPYQSQNSGGGLTASGRNDNFCAVTCRYFHCYAPQRTPPTMRNLNAYPELQKMNVAQSQGLLPPGKKSPQRYTKSGLIMGRM